MKYKAMKVFLYGKRLKDVYPHCTWFQLAKYRLAIGLRWIVGISLWIAIVAFATLVITDNETKIERIIVEAKADYPVLERIAICESENRHFGESGQVLFNGNKNGTVDVGRYMINTVWFKKATELGLDVTKEKDNRLMAEYIYKNFGTEPWVYSKKCWNK